MAEPVGAPFTYQQGTQRVYENRRKFVEDSATDTNKPEKPDALNNQPGIGDKMRKLDADDKPIVATGRANSLSGRFLIQDKKAIADLKTGNLEIPLFRRTKDGKLISRLPDNERWAEMGIPDESLIVGDDGGIANVVIWALDVPEIDYWSGPRPIARIRAKDGRFQPHVLPFWNWAADLSLVNDMPEDVNFHATGFNTEFNVTLAGRGTSVGEGRLGSERKIKLEEEEKFPASLTSSIQPWMKSYVLPLKHPCYAVSDKNGRFKINYLPPGESEFAIWHEKVGWLKTEKFPTGRFKFNVAHTENSIGEVKVDPKIFKKGEPANVVSETPDDQTKFVKEFAKKLEEQLPQGWSVIVSGRFLVVQRDEKTLTLPKFGRRGRSKGETDAEYYADMGAEFTLDVKLRFAPRLSEKKWMELSAHNADLMETSKNGIRSKTELSELYILRQRYQLPRYETSDQSIFQSPDSRYYSEIVDRQAKQEYSDVLALLKKLLPANRGTGAVAGKPEFRWPQVWMDTEPTASFNILTKRRLSH